MLRLILIVTLGLAGTAFVFTSPAHAVPPQQGGWANCDTTIFGGYISSNNYAEMWNIDLVANTTITLYMYSTSDDLDAYLQLHAPDGTLLAEDDDSGGNYDAWLSVTVPVDGTYTITATRAGFGDGTTNGTYAVDISCQQPQGGGGQAGGGQAGIGATVDSGTVTCNATITNSIDDFAEYDTWYYTAQGGETLTFTMRVTSGDLDPYLTVVAPDGIAYQDDDSGGNWDAQITFPSADVGQYVITAGRASGQGEYSLTVECVALAAPPAGAGATIDNDTITCNTPAWNSMDANASYDTYTFVAQGGETLTITARQASGDLDPYLTVYAPDGTTLTDDDSGGNHDAQIVIQSAQAGTYSIVPTQLSGAGEYVLSVDCAMLGAPPVQWQPGPITYPGPGFPAWVVDQGLLFCMDSQTDFIDDNQWYLEWHFEGVATQQVSISMTATSGNLDPYLVLIYPDGTTWVDNDDYNSLDAQIDLTLPQSGTYTIQASRSGGQGGTTAGDFEISVDCLSGGAPAPGGQNQPGGQGQPAGQGQQGQQNPQGHGAPGPMNTTAPVLDRWNARIPLWTTYNLNVYTPSWGSADLLESATDAAITFWENNTAFRFTAVTDPAQADILLNWAQGTAAGGEMTNVYVNYLATRRLPQVHIDVYQPANPNDPTTKAQFAAAVAHAFGHGLGLEYSADASALMYPHLQSAQPQLATDDRDQLLAFYGPSVFPQGNVSLSARPFVSRPFMVWAGQTLSFTLPYPAGVTAAGTVGINANLYALCPIDYYLPGAGSGLAWNCTWSWDDTRRQVTFTISANTTAAAGSGIVAGRAILLNNQAFELVDVMGLSVHPNQPASFQLNAPAGTVVVEAVERFDPAGATDFGFNITPTGANTYTATVSGGNANSVADVTLYVIRPRTGAYSAALVQTNGNNATAFEQTPITNGKRALAFMALSAFQPSAANDFGAISNSQIAALSADPNAACSTANPMAAGALCVDAQVFGVQGTAQSQATWGLYVLQEN